MHETRLDEPSAAPPPSGWRILRDAVRVRLGLEVDLSNPDLELFVEVDNKELLVSADRLRGAGGLPVGSSGRALVLLSGGLDSPVAAYRMMKRGLRCDFVHFSGRPFTGPDSIYKAYALVGKLDRFQGAAARHGLSGQHRDPETR